MITCHYYSASDGWAIIEEDSAKFLLRPPYRVCHHVLLEEGHVTRLLDSGDFLESGEKFQDLDGVTSFLNDAVRTYRSAYSPIADAKTIAFRALTVASIEHIHTFLDGLEELCRGSGDLILIEESIVAVLELPISKKENDLVDRCISILRNVNLKRSKKISLVNSHMDLSRACPLSTQLYGAERLNDLAIQLSQRRSMFAF